MRSNHFHIGLALAAMLALAPTGAVAASTENLGRLMWSGAKCAMYAGMSGNEAENERLFETAYAAGQRLFGEWEGLGEEERSAVPVAVLLRMDGPNADFVLGRIFEGAGSDAYDEVVKTDSAGLRIQDPAQWARDELVVLRARNLYQASNCMLLR